MGRALRSFNTLVEIIDDPLLVQERLFGLGDLIDVGHLQAAMQKAGGFESSQNVRAIELGLGEDRGIRREGDGGTRTANRPLEFLEPRGRRVPWKKPSDTGCHLAARPQSIPCSAR